MRSSIRAPQGLMAALTLALVLAACGEDLPAPTDPIEPSPPDLELVAVSGGGQEGKAGEALPEPFVVRVTDADGVGVADVKVKWSLLSGEGEFVQEYSGGPVSSDLTETDADGVTSMSFRPGQLGTITVVAEIAGLEDSRVTFTVDATGLVVHLKPIFDSVCTHGVDPPTFLPPDAVVPVGTPVEWVFWFRYGDDCTAHVTSTLVPSSGEAFDSGVLGPGDRFRFVPDVAGTWEYRDEVMGQTGTLTAQ